MLQQCKKRDIGYKSVAIVTTGEVVESLEVDVFGELFSIIVPLVHQVGTISTTQTDLVGVFKSSLLFGTVCIACVPRSTE